MPWIRWIEEDEASIAVVTDLEREPAVADLTPRERAIVDYALKLTVTPAAITADDVKRLRAHGLSDAAILDACQVASYYAFVNRLANGLGVELEGWWETEDGASASAVRPTRFPRDPFSISGN